MFAAFAALEITVSKRKLNAITHLQIYFTFLNAQKWQMWSNVETWAQNQVVLVWMDLERHLETIAPCLFRAVVASAIIAGPDGQTIRLKLRGGACPESEDATLRRSSDNWLQHRAKVEGPEKKHVVTEEDGLFPEPLHLVLL